MKEIKLEDKEVQEIIHYYMEIRSLHTAIGGLMERVQRKQVLLHQLREAEHRWEKLIEEKYHLPGGLDWKVDPEKGCVVYREESENSETPPQEATSEET